MTKAAAANVGQALALARDGGDVGLDQFFQAEIVDGWCGGVSVRAKAARMAVRWSRASWLFWTSAITNIVFVIFAVGIFL
jgi:hypothetical protein